MEECDYCNHKGELYSSSDWEENICEPCWQELELNKRRNYGTK